MHCQSCIVIHLDIYKITSTPQHLSCYTQDHNYIGAISLSVHYGDQCTPNLMLITSYPCNSLHQKHAYQPHSCSPNKAMLACHIFCEFNSSMISYKHKPHVGYLNQPIKYNYGHSFLCIMFSFHL